MHVASIPPVGAGGGYAQTKSRGVSCSREQHSRRRGHHCMLSAHALILADSLTSRRNKALTHCSVGAHVILLKYWSTSTSSTKHGTRHYSSLCHVDDTVGFYVTLRTKRQHKENRLHHFCPRSRLGSYYDARRHVTTPSRRPQTRTMTLL